MIEKENGMGRHPTVSFDQLWIFVMGLSGQKEASLMTRWQLYLSVGYKDKYLECCWELYWLREVEVVGSPLGSVVSACWLGLQYWM